MSRRRSFTVDREPIELEFDDEGTAETSQERERAHLLLDVYTRLKSSRMPDPDTGTLEGDIRAFLEEHASGGLPARARRFPTKESL